eukprot:tig00020904_g15212.t1
MVRPVERLGLHVGGASERGTEDHRVESWLRCMRARSRAREYESLLEVDAEQGLRIVVPPQLSDDDAARFVLARLHHHWKHRGEAPIPSRDAQNATLIHIPRGVSHAEELRRAEAALQERFDPSRETVIDKPRTLVIDLPPGVADDEARQIVFERLNEWQRKQKDEMLAHPGELGPFRVTFGRDADLQEQEAAVVGEIRRRRREIRDHRGQWGSPHPALAEREEVEAEVCKRDDFFPTVEWRGGVEDS